MPRPKVKAFDPANKDPRRLSEYHSLMSKSQHRDLPVSKKHADENYVSRSLRNFHHMVQAAKKKPSTKRSAPASSDDNTAPTKKHKSTPDTDPNIKSTSSTTPIYQFKTEMKEGESWKSYCKRIGLEKRQAILASAQKLTFIGEKRKRYLTGRAEGYQKHLTSEQDFVLQADAAIEKQQKNNKQYQDAKKKKETKKQAKLKAVLESGDEEAIKQQQKKQQMEQVMAQRHAAREERGELEFAGTEKVQFGEVVDRPPTLTALPKRTKPLTLSHPIASLSQSSSHDEIDLDRIPEHARPKQPKSPHQHAKLSKQNPQLDVIRERAQAAYRIQKKRLASRPQPITREDDDDDDDDDEYE